MSTSSTNQNAITITTGRNPVVAASAQNFATVANVAAVALAGALTAYVQAPSADTLLKMNLAAVPMLPDAALAGLGGLNLPPVAPGRVATGAADAPRWRAIDAPGAFRDGFTEIRVVLDALLTDDEIDAVTGTLGYALTETVKGEELSLPEVARIAGGGLDLTVLSYQWNSDDCIRSSPNFARAFEVASVYIPHGSKVRTTNLAGPGTRGTRLVDGIGKDRANVAFYVR